MLNVDVVNKFFECYKAHDYQGMHSFLVLTVHWTIYRNFFFSMLRIILENGGAGITIFLP